MEVERVERGAQEGKGKVATTEGMVATKKAKEVCLPQALS